MELGDSLRFLAPGLAHHLGNALFRVQGHAQLLTSGDTEVQRERRAILEAVDRAAHAVQLLHWLLGASAQPPAQAGILLNRLCECLTAPLRERGLRLETRHTSHETPVTVDGTVFCRSLLVALRALLRQAAEGCGGCIQVDLLAQDAVRVQVRLELQPGPAQLPFRIDAAACAQELREMLMAVGVRAAAAPAGRALLLDIPGCREPATLSQPSRALHDPT